VRSAAALALALLCLVTLTGARKSKVVTGKARLDLSIDSPEPGAVVGDPGGMAFLAGRALAHYGEFQTFDIVFVIDVSDSTSAPSGADIDGDGVIGQRRGGNIPIFGIFGKMLALASTDRGDNVLAAEIAAVEVLLDQLDPRTTRVGIVTFSGDPDPFTPDAETWVPLTTDYPKVRRELDSIQDQGPYGRTNMVAGVLTGTVELLGTSSAFSERREGSRRIIIFLTDGTPTLPLEGAPNQNARMAIQKAKKAAEHGIRIDTFAIGPEAIKHPVVTVEMAHVTQGVFTPVRDPSDLVAVFEEVNFADIEELKITNETTKQAASYKIQNADGTFSALVPMREGVNTVRVFARSTDGTEGTRRIKLKYLEGANAQELDPRQLAQRNRLLENRLMDLRRRSMEIQTERDETVREDLMKEIDRERKAAEELAAEQRKQLDLEIEK
jgi:hypothetical protein